MRIISGKHKGKRLVAPRNLPVRPTTDFAKEGLFNILRNHYEFNDLRVLDLFSGTGNISYEFASRGVEDITAVDAHKGCVGYIEKVSRELDLGINTILADVYKYLNRASVAYDLIFADPPYDLTTDELTTIVHKCFENKLLKPEGQLIIEHSKHLDLSAMAYFTQSRKYGGSVFSFFSCE